MSERAVKMLHCNVDWTASTAETLLTHVEYTLTSTTEVIYWFIFKVISSNWHNFVKSLHLFLYSTFQFGNILSELCYYTRISHSWNCTLLDEFLINDWLLLCMALKLEYIIHYDARTALCSCLNSFISDVHGIVTLGK